MAKSLKTPWYVVADLPARSPVLASKKAPVHTDMVTSAPCAASPDPGQHGLAVCALGWNHAVAAPLCAALA
jgi:hypothetical protein